MTFHEAVKMLKEQGWVHWQAVQSLRNCREGNPLPLPVGMGMLYHRSDNRYEAIA